MHSAPESLRRPRPSYAAGGAVLTPAPSPHPHGSSLLVEAIVLDLVEQRLVADLQDLGRLGLVAAGLAQDLLDHLGLHGPGGRAAGFLEAPDGRQAFLGRTRRRTQADVLGKDLVAIAENDGPLDAILQLADVPGPWMMHHDLLRFRRDRQALSLQLLAVHREKMLDEQRDVLPAVAKRRGEERENRR